MKLHYPAIGLFVALFVLLASGPTVYAETLTTESLEKLSKAQLIEMVLDLSAKVSASHAGSELRLRQELRSGMSGEEVRKLQQILATDRSVYPEGLVTGHFGPLTARAVERLHSKFKLELRGEVTAATLDLINTLLDAHGVTGATLPHGLLTLGANRIKIEVKNTNGKVEYKIDVKCDSSGSGNLCKDDDDEGGDEEAEDTLEIETDIRGGKTHVKVELDGEKYRFILNVTERGAVIKELAKRLELSEAEIEAVIEFEDDKEEEEGEDEDEA